MDDDDNALIASMARVGLDARSGENAWRDALPLLAGLDAIGRDGGTVVVKVDGARGSADVYTVVVSGGRLGEGFFRKDGSELRSLLREAISHYLSAI